MVEVSKVAPTATLCEPIEKKIGGTVLKLQHGDLTAMPIDEFVYYAREDLALGSGYGTAIQMRGGVVIKNELDKIGGIKMGEAVISGAGEMKPKHIIHTCGPKFQEADTEKKLKDCMLSSLKVAGENGLKVIAFPPMGAGFYGVSLDVSSRVMTDTIKEFLEKNQTSLEEVIVCVVDYRDYLPFKKQFERL